MDDRNKPISLGTVLALGFIILGILNFFATQKYTKTGIHTMSKLPGILFISVGVIILIVRSVRKKKS